MQPRSSQTAGVAPSPGAALDRGFSGFQQAVCTGLVPGELRSWANGVLDSFADVHLRWRRTREGWRAITDDILEVAPGLGPRVSHLRRRMREQDRQLHHLRQSLGPLVRIQGETPVDRDRAERVRRLALDWIVSCRALGGELDTWFAEAHYRDHGVGD